SHAASGTGSFASLISDIATQGEHVLAEEFRARGYDPKLAPLYAQALVGMVALTGQWWLEGRRPKREVVAAHLVNLAWNGLSRLDAKPRVDGARSRRRGCRASRPLIILISSDMLGPCVMRLTGWSRRGARGAPTSTWSRFRC